MGILKKVDCGFDFDKMKLRCGIAHRLKRLDTDFCLFVTIYVCVQIREIHQIALAIWTNW
jgi:hypothetical protein